MGIRTRHPQPWLYACTYLQHTEQKNEDVRMKGDARRQRSYQQPEARIRGENRTKFSQPRTPEITERRQTWRRLIWSRQQNRTSRNRADRWQTYQTSRLRRQALGTQGSRRSTDQHPQLWRGGGKNTRNTGSLDTYAY